MKRIALVVVLVVWLVPTGGRASRLVLDPGHGGPGASQTSNGGGFNQGRGSAGPQGTAEQWVNLQVALLAGARLPLQGYECVLTRTTDTEDVSYEDRVNMANQWNVDGFISVHHNGLPASVQATEIRWCNNDSIFIPDSPQVRNPEAYTDTLPRKLLYALLDTFQYQNRCSTQNQANPVLGCAQCGEGIYVINNVDVPHVLTEASNLSDAVEEQLFLHWSGIHLNEEANAIVAGWESYVLRQGFGRLEYRYMNASPYDLPPVWVDGQEYSIPYERAWPLNSNPTIEAFHFVKGEYAYYFDHWQKMSFTQQTPTSTPQYNSQIWALADYTPDNYHYWVAYFRGGPFDFSLQQPSPAMTQFNPNTTVVVEWSAPVQAFDACSLYVDFSSNGGSSWQTLIGPIHMNYGGSPAGNNGFYDWTTPNISSTNCRLRIRGWDFVGNRDTVISHQFAIVSSCPPPIASFTFGVYYGMVYKFLDQSTGGTSREWDFGNGSNPIPAKYEQNPLHQYVPGTYQVRLRSFNS